jgi:hypothetical protein
MGAVEKAVSAGLPEALKGHGFADCGKIHHKRLEVSGHDFSRANMRLSMRFGFSH